MRIIFFIVTILILFSCKNSNNDFNPANNIDEKYLTQKDIKEKNIELLFPYSKLKLYLGRDFIPILNKIQNIDNDLNEEYIIAFKKDQKSNINIVIFDIGKSDILKVKFIYESNIFFATNFSIYIKNLFYENDISLIIEGKSKENKNILVILKYEDDDYNIVKEFIADYATIINYKEIETDKAKYFIIKEVITISKSFNTNESNIQKKEIYEWNYDSSEFKIVKTEDFITTNNIILSDILYSEDKYYNYILGFWYPQQYGVMIQNNTITEDLLDETNIKFLFFSKDPNEVGIKYGDYIDKYSIFKISKVWVGTKPGLRLFLNEFSKPNINYIKFMDIYLNTPTSLKINGPERFFIENFIRLSIPFLDYINEKKSEKIKNKTKDIVNFLNGEFKNNDYSIIIKDFSYQLKKDNYFVKGYYKISFIKNYTIITFIQEDYLNNNKKFEDNLLKSQNYIINIFKKDNYFILTPIKLGINDIEIIEVNSIVFNKRNNF